MSALRTSLLSAARGHVGAKNQSESLPGLPEPMFTVVKMSELSTKWPGKYLLNVTVHGFSEALKLSE